MARALGIDYGEKRVGLAISDPSGTVATPLRVVPFTNRDAVVREIVQCARDYDADRLVVGLPLAMDGSIGPAAEKTRAFAETLKDAAQISVICWDERFTTLTAQQALIEGGTRRAKRKEVVDKLAAQILLQHYLDAQSGLAPPADEQE